LQRIVKRALTTVLSPSWVKVLKKLNALIILFDPC
jgi:hypothetical protein